MCCTCLYDRRRLYRSRGGRGRPGPHGRPCHGRYGPYGLLVRRFPCRLKKQHTEYPEIANGRECHDDHGRSHGHDPGHDDHPYGGSSHDDVAKESARDEETGAEHGHDHGHGHGRGHGPSQSARKQMEGYEPTNGKMISFSLNIIGGP